MEGHNHEANTTGAVEATLAMSEARTLIASVAFVSTEGDTAKPLAALDIALGLH